MASEGRPRGRPRRGPQVVDGKDGGDPLAEPCVDVARNAQEPEGQIDVAALGAPPSVGCAIQGISGPSFPALSVESGLEESAVEPFESLAACLLRERGRAVGSKLEDGCSEVGAE